MSALPTQEQIFTHAAAAARNAASALSDVRDWLNADWPDRQSLTDEAAGARSGVRVKLENLKTEIYDLEEQLRGGAKSLRNRR
ncbi:hypothetical protein ABIA39_005684 [Nocardia sp. GAS34]|uniref:hypothetical protein n=1 Tax=unclassified Nocardia TaxID=2637762 RepID=UPI003D1C4508